MSGERKAIVEAEDWDGPSFQTAMDAASVCRKFETSRRHELLSFKHHAEVASLPTDEADALLETSRRRELNRRRLNLSFGHGAEVAALPGDEADALLDLAPRRIHYPQISATNAAEILGICQSALPIPALLPTLQYRNRPFFGDRWSP